MRARPFQRDPSLPLIYVEAGAGEDPDSSRALDGRMTEVYLVEQGSLQESVMKKVLAMVMLVLLSPGTRAADGMITVPSVHPVAITVDRLEQALKKEGFTIFARVDHGAGAASVAMALPNSELLIFGKAEAGTVLMQADAAVGIDLPLKYLVWADAEGGVSVGWNDPLWLAGRHGIDPAMPLLQTMSSALRRFASEAAR